MIAIAKQVFYNGGKVSFGEAGHLLRHFPALTEKTRSAADDALHGGIASQIMQGRSNQGGHSDQTAHRGLKLAQASEQSELLALTRTWIDTELKPGDRGLLLAVWRVYWFGGWSYVAKETRTGAIDCKLRWLDLVESLMNWLNHHYAGIAGGRPGDACVTSRGSGGPA